MRVLVLGSTGMLGHKMVERLRPKFETVIGVSRPSFDATDSSSVEKVIKFFKPDAVLNCVGVIKQREQDPRLLEAVNAKLPHDLQAMCPYLVHFSSDCVFSGNLGRYMETHTPDPVDLYGKTKLAGEVTQVPNTLTIRTSIVGRERNNYKGLLEWFLRQTGDVQGYKNAFFTGVTTNWLADVVGDLLKRESRLSGLYHVASQRISKFDLLKLFQKTYGKSDVNILPVEAEKCDRSLLAVKFRAATTLAPLGLEELLYWQKKTDDEGDGYVFSK